MPAPCVYEMYNFGHVYMMNTCLYTKKGIRVFAHKYMYTCKRVEDMYIRTWMHDLMLNTYMYSCERHMYLYM